MAVFEFSFRTGKVIIDYEKCKECDTYACVKADSLFGTGILRIQNGQPTLVSTPEEAARRCNECLGCELYCQVYGKGGCTIVLDPLGLDELGT